jgi:hypothetical protein
MRTAMPSRDGVERRSRVPVRDNVPIDSTRKCPELFGKRPTSGGTRLIPGREQTARNVGIISCFCSSPMPVGQARAGWKGEMALDGTGGRRTAQTTK